MNILNIAWKGIKADFRDIRTLVFMLAFPIVLMLILGTALSNTFTTSLPIDDIQVLYKDTTKGQYFSQFITEMEKSGIHFEKAGENMDAEKKVKQSKYHGYVEASEEGIKLFVNSRTSIEGSILQGMLSSYVDRYNISSEIIKAAPEKLESAFTREKQDDFMKETTLLPDKEPGAMDYYAIVITTMMVLYGAMSASGEIVSERVRKTGDRLIASPVRKREIFIGKVLGSLVSNSLCIALLLLCSKVFFNAYWGENIGLVFLVLLTEVVFAVSLGIGVTFLTKTNSGHALIIMLFVQLASFFGGAYYKIENPEGIFKFITELSPLTWMNTAMTKIIYTNDFSAAIPALSINIAGSLLFLLFAMISIQRRGAL
ncbi:ABC transporter permease [Bacillus sp. SA1-12]|uniref:ABC transporter permease n=1 Tax=Bacillus sp. SA1-12 TaxID=1455638 RepID=UPI0006273B22|nr:ABC transporter permease [Bacillus sp. SA1-12]KKI89067.1 ABC transporter permease [Bacillus sp. SA1-12]